MSRRRLERKTLITASLAEVFEFFSDPANLARITPPSMGFRIVKSPGRRLREGDVIDYRIRVFGLPLRWRTRIVSWREREAFADLQERGPYRYWLHTHAFRSLDGGVVEMTDVVEYELPFGPIGDLFGARLVARELAAIFAFRAAVIADAFPKV